MPEIVDPIVFSTHLNNVRERVERALKHTSTLIADTGDKKIATVFIIDNIDYIKEQLAMAELYIKGEET